jgi:chromosome segregation ATPase
MKAEVTNARILHRMKALNEATKGEYGKLHTEYEKLSKEAAVIAGKKRICKAAIQKIDKGVGATISIPAPAAPEEKPEDSK